MSLEFSCVNCILVTKISTTVPQQLWTHINGRTPTWPEHLPSTKHRSVCGAYKKAVDGSSCCSAGCLLSSLSTTLSAGAMGAIMLRWRSRASFHAISQAFITRYTQPVVAIGSSTERRGLQVQSDPYRSDAASLAIGQPCGGALSLAKLYRIDSKQTWSKLKSNVQKTSCSATTQV